MSYTFRLCLDEKEHIKTDTDYILLYIDFEKEKPVIEKNFDKELFLKNYTLAAEFGDIIEGFLEKMTKEISDYTEDIFNIYRKYFVNDFYFRAE